MKTSCSVTESAVGVLVPETTDENSPIIEVTSDKTLQICIEKPNTGDIVNKGNPGVVKFGGKEVRCRSVVVMYARWCHRLMHHTVVSGCALYERCVNLALVIRTNLHGHDHLSQCTLYMYYAMCHSLSGFELGL